MRAAGRERVEAKLIQINKILSKIDSFSTASKKDSPLNQKRLASLDVRFKKARASLVFLSTRARDPVTRFYASNALKELAHRK